MVRQFSKQRQETTEATVAHQPVTKSSGVAFSNGVMLVDGRSQTPVRVAYWESTNGLSRYTTVEWEDPATGLKRTSCNCPGWTNAKGDQPRSCCHAKDMEGTEVCNRKRIEDLAITTVAQAKEAIPSIKEGRELRGITFKK